MRSDTSWTSLGWVVLGALLVTPLATGCSGDESSAAGTAAGGSGAGTLAGGGGSGGSGGTATGGQGGGGGAPVTECNGNCHFVREGATGAADGSSWTDAWTALPDVLERGQIYFFAVGSYPGYAFDDPEAATAPIRVLRATAADHGSELGWQPDFAAGEALFGPLGFSAPYVELDGRSATRVRGDFQGTVVAIGAHDVTLRGCDVDGAFALDGNGQHVGGSCSGMDVQGDDVTVADCDIHDAADDGVSVVNSSNVSFVGNHVHALHGCGTDGGCGPCYNGHSDGFELYNLHDSQFVGNLAWDVASTSTFFFGNWADELGGGPSEYCGNVLLANNILYSPDTGFVAYIEDVAGVDVVDNVFWGLHQGAYGGLSIGQNVTGLRLYNNVILSVNYSHIGGSYDPVEHQADYNGIGIELGQLPAQPHDVVGADLGFVGIPGMDGPAVVDPAPEAFAPTAASPLRNAGRGSDAELTIPALDFFGMPRDGTPNIGAIE